MAAGEPKSSFRPRSAYLGHLVVGSGDGAVLIEPAVAGELRMAAARAGGRPAAGLLYGHAWHDVEGGYTLVDGYVPAASAGLAAGEADPRAARARLRQEAARSYPGAQEVGWWRTAPRPGEGGWPDPGAWPLDERPDGVGLVVFADGTPPATAVLPPRNVVQGSVVGESRAPEPPRPAEPRPIAEPARDLAPRREPELARRPAADPEDEQPELEMTLRERASRSGVQSWELVPRGELGSRRRLKPQPGAPVLEARHYVLLAGIILIVVVLVTAGVLVSSAFH